MDGHLSKLYGTWTLQTGGKARMSHFSQIRVLFVLSFAGLFGFSFGFFWLTWCGCFAIGWIWWENELCLENFMLTMSIQSKNKLILKFLRLILLDTMKNLSCCTNQNSSRTQIVLILKEMVLQQLQNLGILWPIAFYA